MPVQIALSSEQIKIVAEALYRKAEFTRTHHRTGENVTEPLFEQVIVLANLFRDAKFVVVR